MTATQRSWWLAITLVIATFAGSAYIYRILPAKMPTHWNIKGEIDGWGPKGVAVWMIPGTMVGVLALFRALPTLSPKPFEVDTFKSTYLYILIVILGLFMYIQCVTLSASYLGAQGVKTLDIGRWLVGGMFLFIGLLGNVMGKVRRNFYIGVRVPWTLASDRVWNDTHRLAAWTMVGGSLVGFVIVAAGGSMIVALGILLVSTLIPVIYSFFHYKSLERRGAL